MSVRVHSGGSARNGAASGGHRSEASSSLLEREITILTRRSPGCRAAWAAKAWKKTSKTSDTGPAFATAVTAALATEQAIKAGDGASADR